MSSKPTYEDLVLKIEMLEKKLAQTRQTKSEVSQAAVLWRNTFDAMRESLMILDRDMRILKCNRAMRELVGKQENEIIGRHCWEAIHGGLLPPADCPCPRVAAGGKRESTVIEIFKRQYEVTVDPQLDEKGQISTFIHILSDITEHKKAAMALREAHQTLLTVFDSIDATIYVADMQTYDILFMNRYMKEAFDGDFTGRVCWQVFRGEKGPCNHCTNAQLLDNTGLPTGVCIWEGLNPLNNRWYLNYDRAIKWMDGRLVRLQVATDISELKEFEKERIETETLLRQAQKMEAIGTLAGGIAHDFNNILSAILGYSELALDDALNNRTSANYIRQIIKAGYRARELVQQILTFSRQTETEAKPIRVKPIIKEALKLLRASLPSTIDINSAVESDGIVEADPIQIHQVIMNLCTNAGHAMRQNGGLLSVSLTEELFPREIADTYPAVRRGRHLRLQVTDTGHGIHPTIRDKIFDPYFTTKEKGEGTGMGLAVVQGIIRNCKGAITVESKLGEGAVFNVYLPIIEQTEARKSFQNNVIPGGDERILVVDDEPALADLGKQLLERLGYKVTVCLNSLDAMALFEKEHHRFDLVITDMTMPHMTGDVLARKMLALAPRIPIVICTGYSEKITNNLVSLTGVKAVVMKPLVRNELALAVRQALNDKK